MAKKCKTCRYRAAVQEFGNCDYILITGHMRGCPSNNCDKYENGERIGLKGHLNMVLKGSEIFHE